MAVEALSFKIGADAKAFRSGIKGAMGSIAGMAAAFISVRAVISSFSDALDMGGRLNDLASSTGDTAGNLAILERSFQNAGAGAENVGPAIAKMQKSIQDASEGTAEAVDALALMGLTAADLEGKLPTEQMQIMSAGIAAIDDPTKRAAAAMGVFGKSGSKLLPLLRDFDGQIQRSKDQLGSLPDVLDKSNQAFDDFGDGFAAIKSKGTEFSAGLLSEVLPAINELIGSLTTLDAAGSGASFGEGLAALISNFGASAEAIGLKMYGRVKDIGNELIAMAQYAVAVGENFFNLAGADLIPNVTTLLFQGLFYAGSEFNKILIDAALNVINALSVVFPSLQAGVQPLIEANSAMIVASESARVGMQVAGKSIKDAFDYAQSTTPYIVEDVLGAYDTYQKAESAAQVALSQSAQGIGEKITEGVKDGLAGISAADFIGPPVAPDGPPVAPDGPPVAPDGPPVAPDGPPVAPTTSRQRGERPIDAADAADADAVEINQPSIRRQPRADKIRNLGKSARQKQIDADRDIPMADRTKGGTLREELDARMDAMKGESEKKKQAEKEIEGESKQGKGPDSKKPEAQSMESIVTAIKAILEKIEPKLPQQVMA